MDSPKRVPPDPVVQAGGRDPVSVQRWVGIEHVSLGSDSEFGEQHWQRSSRYCRIESRDQGGEVTFSQSIKRAWHTLTGKAAEEERQKFHLTTVVLRESVMRLEEKTKKLHDSEAAPRALDKRDAANKKTSASSQ